MRPTLLLSTLLLPLLTGCVQLDVALEGGVDPGLQPLPGGLPMTFDRVGVPLAGYHAVHLPRGEALRRFGVTLVDARPLGAMAPDNARAHPVIVAALERGSPLAHAGVRPFDAIAAIDSKPATTLAAAVARLAGAAPGELLSIAIVRPGGEALSVQVEASDHALEYDQTKLPLLFERQASAGGWSLGLGPLDLLLGVRHSIEHWAVPPPPSPAQTAQPQPGAPPGPPEPPPLGEVRLSRSRFRDRVQWGVLWGLVGWERETELDAGETRSRLRLFWLFTPGDDPLEQPAQGGGVERLACRLGLGLLIILTGCRSHLRPYDPSPLATAESRPTAGGGRLLLDDDGALLRGHGVGDAAGALGFDLAQVGSAVVVGAPRPGREDAGLVQGDELLFAVPVAPWLPGPAPREADAVRSGGPLPDAPGPAGIPIRSLDDLRGLAIGVEGLAVDLVLLRGGQRLVVRVTLVASEVVAARPWSPTLADPLGVELVRLDDWPADRRPEGAAADDLLVTRVARGGLGAKAGLRPLDLVHGEGGRFDVRMGSFPPFLPPELTDAIRASPDWRQATVVRADGREATFVLPEPQAPTDVGFPLLFVYQSNGLAWHLGLLPFDFLFHASGESEHDPRTDTVGEQSRWSFLTTFQVQEIEGGADDVATLKVDPVFDEARMRYASWLLDPAISR